MNLYSCMSKDAPVIWDRRSTDYPSPEMKAFPLGSTALLLKPYLPCMQLNGVCGLTENRYRDNAIVKRHLLFGVHYRRWREIFAFKSSRVLLDSGRSSQPLPLNGEWWAHGRHEHMHLHSVHLSSLPPHSASKGLSINSTPRKTEDVLRIWVKTKPCLPLDKQDRKLNTPHTPSRDTTNHGIPSTSWQAQKYLGGHHSAKLSLYMYVCISEKTKIPSQVKVRLRRVWHFFVFRRYPEGRQGRHAPIGCSDGAFVALRGRRTFSASSASLLFLHLCPNTIIKMNPANPRNRQRLNTPW